MLAGIVVPIVAILLIQPQQSKLTFLGMAGLDPSWRAGITMAAIKHLQFGRDIVFTFGPLGYVLDGLPAPELSRPSAYISLVVSIVASVGLWRALSSARRRIYGLLLILTFGVLFSVETLDYAVFAGTLTLLMFMPTSQSARLALTITVGLVAAFGCLSKLTLGIDILASISAFYFTKFVLAPRQGAATIASLGVIVTITVIALLMSAHWSVWGTLSYLSGAREIISGYSAAMSLTGSVVGEAFALAVLSIVLVATFIVAFREKILPIASLNATALFLSSKHGLVRADWHVLHFYAVAAIISSLLPLLARDRVSRGAAVVAATAGFAALSVIAVTYSSDIIRYYSFTRVSTSLKYLIDPTAVTERERARNLGASTKDVLSQASLRALRGKTVDVMVPGEIALIYVNSLNWRPLPIFQSYSVYTSKLDEINAQALARRGADVELVRYWDLDNLYPLGSEPAAVAELLCRYTLGNDDIATVGGEHYFAMYRRSTPRCETTDYARSQALAKLNADLPLPKHVPQNGFVRAYVNIRTTPFGWIASTFWRTPSVSLEAKYPDGTTRTWRIFAGTAADGILVSPMPRDAGEAHQLLAESPCIAARPLSIRLVAPPAYFSLDSVSFVVNVRNTHHDAKRAKPLLPDV